MHYIRLLKTPRFSVGATNRPRSVSALITITSDLGDDFFFRDATLTAELLQENGEGGGQESTLASRQFQWKIGMRALKIELNVTSSKSDFDGGAALLVISGMVGGTPLADDISHPRGGDLEIITAYSAPFHPVSREEAGRFVQRRFMIGRCKVLKIWEETGESIARHIWDGGLALTAYIAQNAGSSVFGMDKLNALHEQLGLNKRLNVLELGSGCGIVGLGLASLYENCHVTLTDLPLAEEILKKNLKDASVREVVFEPLDWDKGIPNSLSSQHWDIILVADCTYNVASAHSLVHTLTRLVGTSPDAVIVLAHKKRHDSEDLFFELMKNFFRVVDWVSFSNGGLETGILVDIYTFRLVAEGG